MTLYLAIRRNRADMRLLLGSFAVLVLIGSEGPWGANGLTIKDQFARLTTLLVTSKMLGDDQRLTDPLPEIPNDTKSKIRSILDTLNQVDGVDHLRPFFAGRTIDPFASGETGWSLYNAVADAMGLNQYSAGATYVSFTANRPGSIEVAATGRLLGPVRAFYGGGTPSSDEATATFGNEGMTIRWNEHSWTVAPETLMEKAEAGRITDGSPLQISVAPGVEMLLTELSGDKGSKSILRGATFWLVVKE